jgi:UDP-glucose 6-dehydrogenase
MEGDRVHSLGHRVICADSDRAKVEQLNRAEVTIREPDLARLEAAREAMVVFLCLPTPMGAGGMADLGALDAVLTKIRVVLVIDTRNVLDPDVTTCAGFSYHGLGTRPQPFRPQ